MGWRDLARYVEPEDRWSGWRKLGFVLGGTLAAAGGVWLGFVVYGFATDRESFYVWLRPALVVSAVGMGLIGWLREDPRRR